MSNVAHARPVMRPSIAGHAAPAERPALRPVRQAPLRHVEIGTTSQQRRARPKVAYAVVTVLSLFVIFGAQLLLSIVVSDGAYQIESLQSQQKELLRTQQDLSERLDLRDSTQYLAASAAKLGMIPGSSPQFLDLKSGAVSAAPGTIDPTGCGGTCNLVANALLAGVPLVDPAAAAAAAAAATTTTTTVGGGVAPPAAPATPPVVTALPAPVTH